MNPMLAQATKLQEAAMALLLHAPDRSLNIVVLNKALFYLDLSALRDLGVTVTGQRYFALPQGPIVGKYDKKIVDRLEKLGWAKQLQVGNAKPMKVLAEIE
jgi:hypothetical protein